MRPPSRSGLVDRILAAVGGGQISRTYVVRLMACMGVAGVVSEVLPLARSYWLPLTVLGDLRAEFQRTMSEPPSISRSATAWWPAVVGLEQILDAVTAVSLAVSQGAPVPPSGVRQLCAALHAVSEAAWTATPLPADLELPDDETLKPITEAVRALLGVLASGERLGGPG